MKSNPKIVVVTGAESTGKSDLTKWLANYFNVPFIPEYAREYIEKLDRKYSYRDVENIAKKQVEQVHHFQNSSAPLIFVDTWLIITMVWFELVFNKVPPWIEKEIKNANIDLFLVCNTDLPWKPDPVRENGGKKREKLQKKYISNIQRFNFRYALVNGTNMERYQNALQSLTLIKKNKPSK